jgi:alkenylglycerophosphocholine/alkenylglycerophosphoethanolamine hydrolase
MSTAPAPLLATLKPLPVLALTFWAWPASRKPADRLIPIGLLVSALGDVLLEVGSFLAGVFAFLAAHLAYTASFLARTRRLRPLRALPFLAWGIAVFSLLAPVLGRLLWPVGIYALVICVMMWRAAALVDHTGEVRREEWWALAGAVLFGLSDTLLILHRYDTPWPDAPYLVMALYWAGQAGLARSIRAPSGISDSFLYHHAGPPAA